MTCPEILESLENLSDGLIFISETDSEVHAFQAEQNVKRLTPETFLSAIEAKDKVRIETRDFDEFLQGLIKEDIRWQGVKICMEDNLRDLQVFKVGEINLEIYIVGLFTDNEVIGVKMLAVET